MTEDLSKPTIIMGVTGGIAAAKSTLLASRLNKAGFDVRVIMTPNATKFVSELTFRSLTGNKVVTDMFEEPEEWDIRHVSLAKKARLAVICPATANFIGKAANGIADDMLTTTIMALSCPVVVAPAMNDAMWANDAVQANVLKLKDMGYVFAGPVTGRLACGTEGLGRMAEPDAIFDVVMHSYLAIGRSSLKGVKLLVSAGPTVEPIDPVRYIANRSSGKMGYALASAAAARGAEVTLVSGPTALSDPLNVEVKRVDTAEQMLKALEDGFEGCDAFVATAAVADYRAKEYSDRKIKKEKTGIKELELVENPDILAKLSSMKGGRLMVGFAAETEDAIESALGKYSKKGLDMIVVNEVNERNQPFGAEDNIVSIITGKGEVESLPRMSKSELSHMILDRISELMA
ncbi:MAG TPA: bifunctional phosphopantothenoylcysteine decarboxylase/phosphopantothenate--cysteine ligase CoaBC [Bacillota bacterium]|nr:bifunctional phosphopantothenoylcysteine decarboxylase/phosphopantothenate--cysteine ligase CoaBC [Bacillota bacterium]